MTPFRTLSKRLCELGFHDWKPVFRWFPIFPGMPFYGLSFPSRFYQVARKCRCCSKRVRL
jgi:hypothetical protein